MDGPRLEIGFKRSFFILRILWLGPFAVVTLLAALYFAYDVATDGAPISWTALARWIFVGLVLLVLVIDAARLLAMRAPIVEIDAEGVFDQRILRRKLPWSEIVRAETRTQDGKPLMVGFWIKGRLRAYRRPTPFFGYFGVVYVLAIWARRWRFPPLPIDLQPLDAPPARVLEAIERHWGAPTTKELPKPRRAST